MFLFKILTIFAMGLAAARLLNLMFGVMQATRVQVKAERGRAPVKPGTRLAQDPRTGIYYPER